MISLREIALNGLHGQEASFYTGEDAGGNVFLGGGALARNPRWRNKIIGDMGPSLGMGCAFGLADTIEGINTLLEGIYKNFHQMHADETSEEFFLRQERAQAEYKIGIQQFSYLLFKLCYGLVIFKADKIVPKNEAIPPSVQSLFDPAWPSPYKEQIVESVFKRPESIELFKLSEEINKSFQSFHMFTTYGMIGDAFPTVCAYAPPDSKNASFLLHNHSVWQLVKAADAALRDLGYF